MDGVVLSGNLKYLKRLLTRVIRHQSFPLVQITVLKIAIL